MKKSVNDFASIGELLGGVELPEDVEIVDPDGVEETDEEQKVYKTLPTTSLVTVVAYMMGMDIDKLQSHYGEYNAELIDKLENSVEATVIRYLSRLRTAMMQNFKNVDNEMRFNLSNIDRMSYFQRDEIEQLSKWGSDVVRPNYRADKYMELFCEQIQNRIDACRDLFPEWVKFDYIKDLYVIPKYQRSEVMRAEYEKYHGHINMYPFRMYIHWAPEECGNLLLSDGRFLQTLYTQHGDVFRDRSKYRDAVEDTKKNIYDYIDHSGRVMIVVDCENSDVDKLHAVLKNLDADEVAKIEKILLFDDSHTSDGWDYLEKFVSIPVEHKEISRVMEHKSLVDVAMTAGICQAFYRDKIDSFILCSSDSDFWGVISEVPEANFLVLYEYSKFSNSIRDELTLKNIYHCSMDDFYTGNATGIRKAVLRRNLLRETKDINGKNGYEIAKRCFEANYYEASDNEIRQFYEKYVRTIKLKIDSDGNFYFDIAQ